MEVYSEYFFFESWKTPSLPIAISYVEKYTVQVLNQLYTFNYLMYDY